MKTKDGRANNGGARENAGRKKGDIETTTLAFRVPANHAEQLKPFIKGQIEKYLKKQKPE